MTSEGKKFDQGKDRWDLLPIAAIRHVLYVLNFGAKKYGAWNWTKVPDARNRYYSALMRHVTAWYGGENLDPETGIHHLAHAACNALFLLEFEVGQQRYVEETKKETP